MEENRHILICPKCGSEIELVEHQTIGHCSFCDSLIPLPTFVVNRDKFPSATIKNMLNRVNKATEFSLSYQFHRSYNLYDKLIKNNYNLNIRDAYPFIGKFTNQYGVVNVMNDKLELEIVCLNILKESVYENEYYQKAIIYSDYNAQSIIKKLANEIDKYQKDVRKELIKSEPVDVCILVDDSNKESNDLSVAIELKEKLKNLKHSATITEGCFNGINKENVIKLMSKLTMAKHLIILAKDFDTLNGTLFRNAWMNYFSDEEVQINPSKFMSIVTDCTSIENLPIKDLPIYTIDNSGELLTSICKILEETKEVEKAQNLYPELTELINNDEYDEVKDALNKKLRRQPLDYQGWKLLFLAKHRIKKIEDVEKLIINPMESYYFQRIYMYANRRQKEELYNIYLKCMAKLESLEDIDEEYEKELDKERESLYKKDKVQLALLLIPIIISTIIAFITLSLANTIQFIMVLGLNILCYSFFITKLVKILTTGYIPRIIKANNGEKAYIQQLKKVLKPKEASKYIPTTTTKKHHIVGVIILSIALLISMSYVVKETIIKIENKSITYYYLFDKAFVTGGTRQKVIVPTKINGRDVVAITKNAFERNNVVEEVIIEDGVKTINSLAFKECSHLERVEVTGTIEKLYDAPFEGCSNLKEFIYYGTKFKQADFFGPNYDKTMPELEFFYK